MNHNPRTVHVSSPPTTRLLRACAAFGLALRHAPARRVHRAGDARRILRALRSGQISLITGPSGGGKSSLLEDISRECSRRRRPALALPGLPREAPIIDLIPGPLAEAIATLARAGLGDATLLARTPAELSEGERFRFRLALAMSRIPARRTPATLLIDEFASTLDRTTARCLCLTLRRWLHRANAQGLPVRLIIATAHHDVAEWLAPDLTAVVPPGGGSIDFTHAQPARVLPARIVAPSQRRAA